MRSYVVNQFKLYASKTKCRKLFSINFSFEKICGKATGSKDALERGTYQGSWLCNLCLGSFKFTIVHFLPNSSSFYLFSFMIKGSYTPSLQLGIKALRTDEQKC